VQDKLSLTDCINRAVEENYGIKIAENEELVGKQNVNYSVFLPTIYLDGTQRSNYLSGVTETVSAGRRNFNNSPSDNITASANFYWRIFDGANMFFTYNKTRQQLEIQELKTISAIEQLISDVSAAYYNVWIQGKLLKAAENIAEISQERYKIAYAKYIIGSLSGLEMNQSRIDLNADSSVLVQQRNSLINAYIKLNTLMNSELLASGYIIDTLTLLPLLNQADISKNALDNNTSLLIAQKGVNIAELDVKSTLSNFLPTIDFNGGYQYSYANTPASAATLLNRSNGFFWGFTARIPIFSGMENYRQNKVARLTQQNLELSYKDLELSVLSSIAELHSIYQTSFNLLGIESQNLEITSGTLESALEKYRIGSLSGLEFREFQRSYIDAVQRLMSTSYQAKISEIGLMLLSGGLK
jgi:outer membrane protein TolC